METASVKTCDVTIVVGCYKQEKYLAGAVQSAEDQVSPQDANGILGSRMPTFCVQTFVDTEGIGASAARNKAMQFVLSPWVVFLDADDRLPSHFLFYMWNAKKWDAINADDKCFVGPSVQFTEGVRMDRLFYTPDKKIYGADCFRHYCPCATISGLFSREAYDLVGGFDENLRALNDWDFWLRIAQAGYTYRHCSDTFVLRRSVPNSITNTGMSSVEKSKAILKAFNDKHSTYLTTYPQGYPIPAR